MSETSPIVAGVAALQAEIATLRTRAEAAEARVAELEAERDEAIKHVQTWVKWCDGPARPHPWDNVQAAKKFLALIKAEG